MTNKRQLAGLFLCVLVPLTNANALISLLPVYASELGADAAQTGLYLALAFFALAAGSLTASRISRRKRTVMACAFLSIPVYLLMSQTDDIGRLSLLVAANWFLGGVSFSLVNILAGLSANKNSRGAVFGMISLGVGLGGLLGGIAAGPIVDRWGYPALFQLAALVQFLAPLSALLLQDHQEPQPAAQVPKARFALNRAFYLLMGANVVAGLAMFVSTLGRPLEMSQLQFDAASISSTVAIASAVTLPIPAFIGWLSDRIGRRSLIAICYLVGTGGVAILTFSTHLWHFWISAVLVQMIIASGGVLSALVTDLVPPESLSTGLSLLNTSGFAAGVIGLAATGFVIEAIGMPLTFALGAALPIVAIFLLMSIGQMQKRKAAHP